MTLHSLSVREFMSRKIMSLAPNQDVIEASSILTNRRISGAPVVSDIGNLVGVLSDYDCIRAKIKQGFDPEWRGIVSDFMSDKVATADINDTILQVAERFIEERYRRFPVMEDNRLVGQISRIDVLRALEKLNS